MPATARARNAEGLLGIFVVWDFGATGDGQHDDSGGIQAAILAAGAAGGGLVAIPAGMYRLGSNVVWGTAANVTIWQHSGATFAGPGTLPAATGSNAIRTEPSGATVGGVPTTSAVGDAAGAGVATTAAATDHLHGREAFGGAAVVQAFGDAAAAGAAATPARSDHRHGIPGAPAAIQQGVNNGQEIWQRGPGPFTANNGYAADRWQLTIAGTDTLSVSRDQTAANKLANSGSASTLTFVLGTGAGATRYKQRLTIADGYQHLLGQPFSVRVPAKGNAANAVRAFVTTDGTGGTTTFGGFHSGGGGFENLDVPNVLVPADATIVEYGVALAATVTVSIDNVMPTVSTTAQTWMGLTPAEDLPRCLRYYQRFGPGAAGIVHGAGQCTGATTAVALLPLLARMGGSPTLTVSAVGDFRFWGANSVGNVCTALSLLTADGAHVLLSGSVASGLVAGNATVLDTANTNAWLALEWNP